MPQIDIFTTPACGYCKMAKEYFKSQNLEYTEHNVFEDEKARDEMIAKSQQMGVPVIMIDGNMVIGFDKPKIDKFLSESGNGETKAAA